MGAMASFLKTAFDFTKETIKKALVTAKIPIKSTPVQNGDLLWLHATTAWEWNTSATSPANAAEPSSSAAVAPPESSKAQKRISKAPPGNWNTAFKAEFVASFFHARSSKHLSGFIAETMQALHISEDGDEQTRKLLEKRAADFLNSVIVGRTVSVRIDGGGVVDLPPSNESGISASTITAPFGGQVKDGDIVRMEAILPKNWKGKKVHADMGVVTQEGWAIISDIDDTIKVSEVLDYTKLLRHTFVEETPQTTPGMPDFYALLKSTLNPAFFYLSASPYNLYPFLLPFLREHYPFGEPILRDMSWMDVGGLMSSVSVGTQAYKVAEAKKVVGTWLPKRQFIFIGDSTQKDPESYGELYKMFPERVKAIWIRVVSGVDSSKEKDLNSEERFAKAFDGVPRNIWTTFTDPSTLQGRLDALGRGE